MASPPAREPRVARVARVEVDDKHTAIAVGDGEKRVLVSVAGTERALVSVPATRAWIERATGMVTDYFGRWSVDGLVVDIITYPVGDIGYGEHMGGEWVHINAGAATTAKDLQTDWVLVHELLHTAFPSLPEGHQWMREGLSTYLETIVRARCGAIDDASAWHHFAGLMRNGLPDPPPDARGLDDDGSWGATYWGGALFWLIADVRIREATHGEKSLQDSLRAILAAGGDSRETWPMKRVLDTGDAATGTHVLHELYAEMAEKPIDLDKAKLAAFFRKLGARERGPLDDTAPLAAIRKSMTAKTCTLPDIAALP